MGTSLKLRYMALIRVTKMQNNEMSGRKALGYPRRDRENRKHYSSACGLLAVREISAIFLYLYEYPVMHICNSYIYTAHTLEMECEIITITV